MAECLWMISWGLWIVCSISFCLLLSFPVFPVMFVFVHIGFDQVGHFHWVDLSTLTVADLESQWENK